MSLSISNTKKSTKLSAESRKMVSASKIAVNKAVRESKKLGLEITFLENGKIYKESPGGKRVIVSKITTKNHVVSPVKLTKGMVLHAKF
jgi:hypothetical protein